MILLHVGNCYGYLHACQCWQPSASPLLGWQGRTSRAPWAVLYWERKKNKCWIKAHWSEQGLAELNFLATFPSWCSAEDVKRSQPWEIGSGQRTDASGKFQQESSRWQSHKLVECHSHWVLWFTGRALCPRISWLQLTNKKAPLNLNTNQNELELLYRYKDRCCQTDMLVLAYSSHSKHLNSHPNCNTWSDL